eukprot:2640762-Pyramimonas_sp.AAC.1
MVQALGVSEQVLVGVRTDAHLRAVLHGHAVQDGEWLRAPLVPFPRPLDLPVLGDSGFCPFLARMRPARFRVARDVERGSSLGRVG